MLPPLIFFMIALSALYVMKCMNQKSAFANLPLTLQSYPKTIKINKKLRDILRMTMFYIQDNQNWNGILFLWRWLQALFLFKQYQFSCLSNRQNPIICIFGMLQWQIKPIHIQNKIEKQFPHCFVFSTDVCHFLY